MRNKRVRREGDKRLLNLECCETMTEKGKGGALASRRGERREREGESKGRKVDVRGGLEGKEGRRTEGRRGRRE